MRQIICVLFIGFTFSIGAAQAENDSFRIQVQHVELPLERLTLNVPLPNAGWKAERIATLDAELVTAAIEGDRQEVRREIEPQINALLENTCIGNSESADLQRLSGAILSVRLRRAFHSFPLRTERDALRDSPLAEIDLALDRHLARYADALAADNNDAQIAVLQEMLSGLLVLSADQVETFANRLGEVLEDHTDTLGACNDVQRHAALSVTINPALLVFDLAKYRGFNAIHRWLEAQATQLRRLQVQPTRLYTFDPVAGMLIGFEDPAFIVDHLDKLIDPDNIAFGHCSIGQMASAGAETGNFGCGFGPHCTPGKAAPKRRGFFAASLSGLFGSKRFNNGPGPARSPFDVPTRELSDNCTTAGAGTSGGQAGGGPDGGGAGGPFGPSGSGFATCLANAAFQRAVADDPARCVLAARQRLQDARNNETIIVGQGQGGPVIRGIYGNDSCTSDPRMAGADQYRRQGGAKSPSDSMRDAIKETADELRREGSAAQKFIQIITDKEMSQQDFNDLADGLEARSRVCQGCLDDAYGETDTGDRYDPNDEAEYTFDADAHESNPGECNSDCYNNMRDTALHEAGHGANRRDYRDHERMRGYGKAKDVEEKAKEIAEQIKEDNSSMPQPGEPYQPCGPVAEAYRDMMACSAGQVAGMDGKGNPIPDPGAARSDGGGLGGGLGNTDGNVDPSEEQWINGQYGNNAFSRCTASEGLTVVGENGRVFQIGGDRGVDESCHTITCRQPAKPKTVNGTCRCVVEGQRGRIAGIIAQHERTQSCGRMTVDCTQTPHSPCCQGGGTDLKPDLGLPQPGGDPSVFKLDLQGFSLRDKLDLDGGGKPTDPGDDRGDDLLP